MIKTFAYFTVSALSLLAAISALDFAAWFAVIGHVITFSASSHWLQVADFTRSTGHKEPRLIIGVAATISVIGWLL